MSETNPGTFALIFPSSTKHFVVMAAGARVAQHVALSAVSVSFQKFQKDPKEQRREDCGANHFATGEEKFHEHQPSKVHKDTRNDQVRKLHC